jgi:nucleoside-diphosphate-sugar epimerase
LRLPTISVRPGKPNAAASSFASGIIREPLAGEAANCPVSPETPLWLLSPRGAIAALVRGMEIDGADFGERRTVNLPGLSVTPKQMVAALRRVAGDTVADRVGWEREARIENIVGTWPAAWNTERALALGFQTDADFDAVIRAYMEDAGIAAR